MTTYPKSYAETYDMRSRHYQLLGEIGRLMADAFMQADSENQRNIAENAMAAMQHCLIEHKGYNALEIEMALRK